jgi:hypothetical protein
MPKQHESGGGHYVDVDAMAPDGKGGGSHKREDTVTAAPWDPETAAFLSPMSPPRRLIEPSNLSAAHALFMGMLYAQRDDGSRDVMAADAPWRFDDTIVSPAMWPIYSRYPRVVDDVLRYGDTSTMKPKERAEFMRYLGLARFGEVEKNVWRIFKRICKQKKEERVSTNSNNSRSR